MKRIADLRSFMVVVLIAINAATLPGQNDNYGNIRWEKERLAPGLVWKHAHTTFGDTLLQNVNLLIVNTRKRDISIVYNPSKGRRVTGIQAAENGSIAAVNGGFFNAAGGSVTYIRTAGLIADADTAGKWPKNANLNGAILVGTNGDVQIVRATTNGWFDSNTQFHDVLVTGPLLAEDGVKSELPSTSLVTTKHPRTAVGKMGKKKVLLLTVDGRTSQSYGLTLHELADLMLTLKCSEALNLDGGGSTTMWLKGKPESGVVNMPCDNRLFDHGGSRAVSSIITVK